MNYTVIPGEDCSVDKLNPGSLFAMRPLAFDRLYVLVEWHYNRYRKIDAEILCITGPDASLYIGAWHVPQNHLVTPVELKAETDAF